MSLFSRNLFDFVKLLEQPVIKMTFSRIDSNWHSPQADLLQTVYFNRNSLQLYSTVHTPNVPLNFIKHHIHVLTVLSWFRLYIIEQPARATNKTKTIEFGWK